MYVVVHHQLKDPDAAAARAQKLISGEGAPPNTRNLQMYPGRDVPIVTCLWEADSVEAVQDYVDSTLGDSSENKAYEVLAEQAYSERPSGISESPPA